MKILSAGNTDKGRTRKNNEDSFLVDEAAGLFAVADGIGGHQGGEIASRMAIETLGEMVRAYTAGKGNTPPRGAALGTDPAVSTLTQAFIKANTSIRETASRDRNLEGMGTTLTALFLAGKKIHLAHVGDSRAYLLRNGSLEQLSEDHGVVAEQLRAGLITPDQARKSPYRHVITRALGIDKEVPVDHRIIEVRQSDTFLLCSDGLTEMIEDPGIERVLRTSDPAAAVQKLIAEANDRGGVDNITVVIIRVQEVR
jgi:protein phosphatase